MKCVIDYQKRESDTQVCDGCRRRLGENLRELVDAYAILATEERMMAMDAGPVPGQAAGERVSGTGEPTVPANLDRLDLLASARAGNLRAHVRGLLGDDTQIGHLPIATQLATWVRDWHTQPWMRGDQTPQLAVSSMVSWFLIWLEDACDNHPAIDEFASDVDLMLWACRALAKDKPQRREVLKAVPCSTPDCDGLLLHDPSSQYWAECCLCHRLWTEPEYREWVGLVAAHATRPAA